MPKAATGDLTLHSLLFGPEHLPDNSPEDFALANAISQWGESVEGFTKWVEREQLPAEDAEKDPAAQDGALEGLVLSDTEELSARLQHDVVESISRGGAEPARGNTDPLISATLARLGLAEGVMQKLVAEGRPENVKPPEVAGNLIVGDQLHCTEGEWRAQPSPTYSYKWFRESNEIQGEGPSGRYHKVSTDDVGTSL